MKEVIDQSELVETFGNYTIMDYVLQSEEMWSQLKKREKSIELVIRRQQDVECEMFQTLALQLKTTYEKLYFLASGQAKVNAKVILNGLGWNTEAKQQERIRDMTLPRRKVATLARALFMEPFILLIDRPTYYLDVDAITWLEGYLKSWPNSLVINCQDRTFVDSICNSVILLSNRKIYSYAGNLTEFTKVIVLF